MTSSGANSCRRASTLVPGSTRSRPKLLRHMLMAYCCGGAVLQQLASRLMGPAVKACSPFLRTLLAKLFFCLLCVLVCLLTCFNILLEVLPAVLVITGNRKSLSKLQVSVFGSLITHITLTVRGPQRFACCYFLPAHAYLPMPVHDPMSMELYAHAAMVASGRRHASTHRKRHLDFAHDDAHRAQDPQD